MASSIPYPGFKFNPPEAGKREAQGLSRPELFHSYVRERALSPPKAHIKETCENYGANRQELISGSRRRRINNVRFRLAVELVEEIGLSLEETARQLGMSTSAESKIIHKHEN